MGRAALVLPALLLAAGPACAGSPTFGLSLDLSPQLSNDQSRGPLDAYLDATLTGTLSGSFDNGLSYFFSGSAILERHHGFRSSDTDYANAVGQLSLPVAELGRLKLRAVNLTVFAPVYSDVSYNVTDIGIGFEHSFDIGKETTLTAGLSAGRRLASADFLQRNSLTPTLALSSAFMGLDASLVATYSYRDFIGSDRRDHYFGASATLSKDFKHFSTGFTVSLDATRSNFSYANSTSVTIGPNLTYNFPID